MNGINCNTCGKPIQTHSSIAEIKFRVIECPEANRPSTHIIIDTYDKTRFDYELMMEIIEYFHSVPNNPYNLFLFCVDVTPENRAVARRTMYDLKQISDIFYKKDDE